VLPVMKKIGRALKLGMLGAFLGILITSTDALSQPSLTELMSRLTLSRYPPGVETPEFKSCCHRGEALSLAQLRGKVILLSFWASWCTECHKDMPAFERLHRELTPGGLSVVGINLRQGRAEIDRYARELGLTFPLLSDVGGKIQAAYGVVGVPTTFLIGRDGQPVALAIGGRSWDSPLAREIIQRLLAKPGTAHPAEP
jgi:peroxiredoxin